MTVFETMQEEDIKILTPLLLITDFWLQALIFYKPLDTSGTRDQIANIHWIIKKAWEFKKNFCFVDYAKAF